MTKKRNKFIKGAFLVIILLLINAFISLFIYKTLLKEQNLVYFQNEPREKNELYGFFKVSGETYYQIYTTTQVNIENGLHYHIIDIRGSKR